MNHGALRMLLPGYMYKCTRSETEASPRACSADEWWEMFKQARVEQTRSETANVEATVRKLTGTGRTPERLGKEHSWRDSLPGVCVLGRFTQGNATKRRVEQ